MFHSILCPIDFSEHAERALAVATQLATEHRAHLTLLHVTDPLLEAAARAAGSADAVSSQTQAELRALFARVAPNGSAPPMAVAVVAGAPARQILTQATECGADLIVMGMHGAGAAERLIMGSTTSRVLDRARVPVLAVPPPRR